MIKEGDWCEFSDDESFSERIIARYDRIERSEPYAVHYPKSGIDGESDVAFYYCRPIQQETTVVFLEDIME